MSMPDTGLVIASFYRRPVVFISMLGSFTCFPLWSAPHELANTVNSPTMEEIECFEKAMFVDLGLIFVILYYDMTIGSSSWEELHREDPREITLGEGITQLSAIKTSPDCKPT
ncbi:hypothetical protein Ccrd_010383, partial [Cynara cardunculus var. scolymus]